VRSVLAAVNLSGYYGLALSSVGLLTNLGISLATDAFGPVADNAGGIAEMAGMPPETRDNTDVLDALGEASSA
jgi:K(+)-stimulated pyrophosphate-energized sodium pump